MKILNFNDDLTSVFAKIEFEALNSVGEIINAVRQNKDSALLEYSKKFGDGESTSIEVSQDEIDKALKSTDPKIIEAIEYAIKNVKQFAQAQLDCLKPLELKFGENSSLGHNIIPLDSVGCYIPGGNYPLLSTAVMTVVPAKVAGVERVIACSPKIHDATIVGAYLSGADKIYKVGGVQAIAAMAYGTETIKQVNKIVGPGNKYVTSAKKQVFGECGIDFLAGPSEVLIVADESANIDYVAADILAQCEHDADAKAYLVCFNEEFAKKIIEQTKTYLEELPNKSLAKQAFESSCAIVVDTLEQAITISEKRAPEHLELCFKDAQTQMHKFKNYGSLFIGNHCAEVFGDYCSGTNHTLPTNQVAKYCGGLSVFDYIKVQTYQSIDAADISEIAEMTSILANTEGLIAHQLAANLRRK